ncbi:MAG: carotenoid 1,2-hydratase [Acidobacteria bacterium]|nr:carotenoid 1,2-hydratase [Acidobacteriota bacterium]
MGAAGIAAYLTTTFAVSVALLLAGDTPPRTRGQFCQATPGYRFSFPRDHFEHRCFRTEWWYFTGNLTSNDGRRFGFELTFFRQAVDNPYQNPSRWRIDDLYLAHFAVSDLQSGKFFYTERLNRAGIELAGADHSRGRIWNGDWSAEIRGTGLDESWSVDASDGGYKIHLVMRPEKAPVLHAESGLSRKSAGAGNASYYYSLTRLRTSGSLVVNGTAYEVTGLSWMDHEFFTHSMAPNQSGWDWVSLQMDDGTEWMLYRFRRADGSRDPFSSGTFVDRNGKATHLRASDFEMQPLETWRSPHSGANYPVAWRIVVPRLSFQAEIRTSLPDQELVSAVTSGLTYWEGSIVVRATQHGSSTSGRGYLEMTGYAGPISPMLNPK